MGAALPLILTLLNSLPQIFAAAESLKADLSTTDQATLNAAIAVAQAAAITAGNKLEADTA